MTIDYAIPGLFTDLSNVAADRFTGLGGTAPEMVHDPGLTWSALQE
ncbi:MAG: hypothetical protein ACTH2Q_11520 [Propionibacteriaceae bacterium]